MFDLTGLPFPSSDALCLGEDHACAVLPTGENGAMQVQCWGDNAYGQVQPTSPGGQAQPANRQPQHRTRRVFCAEYHTCAVDREGRKVECWGKNSDGQLGGEPVDGIAKVTVLPDVPEGWFQLVGGEDFTCAIEPSNVLGAMYCWGSNLSGRARQPRRERDEFSRRRGGFLPRQPAVISRKPRPRCAQLLA